MAEGIIELAAVVLIAAALGVVAKMFRQPVILAYLVTGILIGALGFTDLIAQETFRLFSSLGIMFLLFLVGLEVNYASLRLVGKASVLVGLGQIVFTAALGYGLSLLLGFETLPALYLAVALTFSSTIIVVKLLSDRKDLQSLYGRISVGFLLVQDAVAILILLFLSGAGAELNWWGIAVHPILASAVTIAGGIALFLIMLWLGRKALPPLFDRVARSEELLFLISLAWLFSVVVAVSKLGFSIEIAGFMAGLALANSSERFQIASRIAPLRDFFILVFFVILGASVSFSSVLPVAVPVAALSLFVLVGNPLIVLVVMGLMGYRRRTSFFSGITTAQISEFSFILVAMGAAAGHVGGDVVATTTAVGVITIAFSVYMITRADEIYRRLAPLLSIFEKRHTKEIEVPQEGFHKPIVLVGCHRTGEVIAMSLPREKVLVVDFDPEVIRRMTARGFVCLFGDARDREIVETANAGEARLLISTSPELEDNLTLLEGFSKRPIRPKLVMRAETEDEARILYAHSADYVLLPHFTAGQYFGRTLGLDPEMKVLEELKARDLAVLANHHRGKS
ncbi:MAG: cation:proton antiporter [Candidatus Brennerbacteria bacterium]|nr:cation:proton antiporter [Candidatus Brennerbacteria bacterium]